MLFGSIRQDLRFAIRLLTKDRWFTTAAVVALALGIGANTIVFTMINGWNLQQLPVEEPDRIVHLGSRDAQGRSRGVSYLDFLDWRQASRAFSGLAAYSGTNMSISVERRPADRLAGTFISATGFSVLRERPVLGRDFRPEDDRIGAEPVVIIGHGVWTDRFGAASSIVGRTIRVNGAPATVIGVMPEGFRFPVQSEIWQPIAHRPGIAAEPRDVRTVGVFGRLADNITVTQARAELSTIAATLAQQFPATNQGIDGTVVSFTEHYFGSITDGPPLIMMAAVGVVLLIACANAANLLLARAAYRAHEISLRRALGASRRRIVRQLLVESLLLAVLAGICGLLLAWPVVRLIAAETADFNLPYWARLTFDARVFGYLATVCAGTALLFGLAPAWKLSRADTAEMLKRGGRTGGGGLRSRRLTSALLVAELALSVILLASAGLLIRSALVLHDADRIVNASNVLTARLSLPAATYGMPQRRIAFYERLEERLRSIPSIASASIATALPFAGAGSREVALEGDVESESVRTRSVTTVAIGTRYHETLGLSVQRGRRFEAGDGLPGQEAAIVNERFAAVHSPGQDPIGRRIRLLERATSGTASSWLIVGIVPSIRHSPARDAQPAVYLPLRAEPSANVVLLVRGRGNSAALAPVLREELRGLDPDLPLFNISTLERLSQQSRWTHRTASSMLGLFAAIAMLLSAMGLYAVTAYAVSQRTSEIGLCMALGAQRSQVSWLFLRATLVHLGLGLTLGIAGAMAAGQLLRGVLVQTSALDPTTFACVVVLLVAVALLACLVPARRAAALDPAVALRHE